jgi:SAM-dependent methyltransferase
MLAEGAPDRTPDDLEDLRRSETINLRRLEKSETTDRYTAPRNLLHPELAILSAVGIEFSGKRILDLGVGGGQTTPALLEISDNYVGSDVSPRMVSLCRTRFPTTRFEVCDARDLSQFQSGSFDLIAFFGAGIDAVGHRGRFEVLKEIYRALDNGGALIFSAHNLRATIKKPWHPSKLPWTVNPFAHPKRFAARSARLALETFNHIRNRRHEIRHADYSIFNDEADHYNLLLYYITVEAQIRQLIDTGFHSVRPVDLTGKWLTMEDYPDCRDTWIHYLCRKS